MATGGPHDKLLQLEKIENEIAVCLQNAGLALQELSKDKPMPVTVQNYTTGFLKSLQNIENGTAMQINYLLQCSTGTAHEGSVYGALKDRNSSLRRMQYVKTKLNDLEQLHNDQLNKRQAQSQAKMSESNSVVEQR